MIDRFVLRYMTAVIREIEMSKKTSITIFFFCNKKNQGTYFLNFFSFYDSLLNFVSFCRSHRLIVQSQYREHLMMGPHEWLKAREIDRIMPPGKACGAESGLYQKTNCVIVAEAFFQRLGNIILNSSEEDDIEVDTKARGYRGNDCSKARRFRSRKRKTEVEPWTVPRPRAPLARITYTRNQ